MSDELPSGEQRLADAMRTGDPEALAAMFDDCRPALRRMIDLRMDPRVRVRVAPSDVLQDAYLEAAKRLVHYAKQPDLPPRVWLRWVAGQRLIDLHRRHLGAKRRSAGLELSIDRGAWPAASSVCMAAQLVAAGVTPDDELAREEERKRMAEGLGQLSPLDREVLALRHFEELSNAEVAALLGLQPGTASKRYVRALDRLREVMDGAA